MLIKETASSAERSEQKKSLPRCSEMTAERRERLQRESQGLLRQCALLQKQMKIFNLEKSKIKIIQNVSDKKNEILKPLKYMQKVKQLKASAAMKSLEEYKVKKGNELQKIEKTTQALMDRISLFQQISDKLIVFKKFIEDTIDLLPKDYIKSQKGKLIEGLMSRFQSLLDTNDLLCITMEHKNKQMKKVHGIVLNLLNDNEKICLKMGADVKEIIDIREATHNKVNDAEIHYFNKYSESREMLQRFGLMIISLNNITNKCISAFKVFDNKEVDHHKSPLLKTMDTKTKLDKIMDFVMNNLEILGRLSQTVRINPDILKIIAHCKFN